jgi:HEAT repeat protein
MKVSNFAIACVIIQLFFASNAWADREEELLAVLQSQADVPAKCEACRELLVVGTTKAVPVLASCLDEERLSDAARWVLEQMQFSEATQALREALARTSGANKVGVIESLGWKRDAASVRLLVLLLSDPEFTVASAAVASLGRIGGSLAVEALSSARRNTTPALDLIFSTALLHCADDLLAGNAAPVAAKIYALLCDPEQPEPVRQAAWRGLVLSDSQTRSARVFSALGGIDKPLGVAALKFVRETSSETLIADGLKRWTSLDPGAQLAFFEASAKFPVLRARAIQTGLDANSFEVRKSAWMAMSELPSVSREQIENLAITMAQGEPAEREAAHQALLVLHGKGVAESLTQICERVGASRADLLRILGERGDPGVESILLKYASANGPDRIGALYGLGKLASLQTLKPLLELAATSNAQEDAQPVLEAIYGVFLANRASGEAAAAVIETTRSYGEVQRRRILPLMAEIGTDPALEITLRSVAGSDPGLRKAALLTAAEWPSSAPAQPLLGIAKSASDPLTRALAWRAVIRTAAHEKDLSKKLTWLSEAMAGGRLEEKRMALSEIGRIPTDIALRTVLQQMKNPDLIEESASAAVSIAEDLSRSNPELAGATANAVLSASKAPETRKRARELQIVRGGSGIFIQDWMVCGPFRKEGAVGAAASFGVPFGPEKGEQANWKAMPRADRVNLLTVFPGQENCAAYLRTHLFAPAACDATLLIGSDDGVKVWLDGKVVHSNNVDRGLIDEQDKVPIQLRAGANELLIKVTQGAGGWMLSARIVGADGTPLPGLQVRSAIEHPAVPAEDAGGRAGQLRH